MNTEVATAENGHLPANIDGAQKYVTMRLDNQLFGLPVEAVQDVLRPQNLTPVPLSPQEVAGLINLRGRIVTVIDMRKKMGLPPGEKRGMEVVIEFGADLYSLVVDSVDEVLSPPENRFENSPPNLSSAWSAVASGVYRLKEELMVVLDTSALFKGIINDEEEE